MTDFYTAADFLSIKVSVSFRQLWGQIAAQTASDTKGTVLFLCFHDDGHMIPMLKVIIWTKVKVQSLSSADSLQACDQWHHHLRAAPKYYWHCRKYVDGWRCCINRAQKHFSSSWIVSENMSPELTFPSSLLLGFPDILVAVWEQHFRNCLLSLAIFTLLAV